MPLLNMCLFFFSSLLPSLLPSSLFPSLFPLSGSANIQGFFFLNRKRRNLNLYVKFFAITFISERRKHQNTVQLQNVSLGIKPESLDMQTPCLGIALSLQTLFFFLLRKEKYHIAAPSFTEFSQCQLWCSHVVSELESSTCFSPSPSSLEFQWL